MWGDTGKDDVFTLTLTRAYGDASLEVDVRLADGAEQRILALMCRTHNSSRPSGYFLAFMPALQRFWMGRARDGTWETMAGPDQSEAIKRGAAVNRVELACVGDTISGRVNGVEVAVFRDDTTKSGRFALSMENDADLPLPIDVRLDNLVINER